MGEGMLNQNALLLGVVPQTRSAAFDCLILWNLFQGARHRVVGRFVIARFANLFQFLFRHPANQHFSDLFVLIRPWGVHAGAKVSGGFNLTKSLGRDRIRGKHELRKREDSCESKCSRELLHDINISLFSGH